MDLVTRVSRLLTGSEGDDRGADEERVADEETFEYDCMDCGTTFAEPRTRMVRVSCPNCDSVNLQVAE